MVDDFTPITQLTSAGLILVVNPASPEGMTPAQIQAALGDLDRVRRIVKLGGFVNAAPDFVEIPKVVNGCSDLMVTAFGEKGKHARSAVACPVLPMGAAVEVDAVVEFG